MDQNDVLQYVKDNNDHQQRVFDLASEITDLLMDRAEEHDDSKTTPEEIEGFVKNAPKLKTLTYNSDEYKECLKGLNETLAHHYANNRHHPEHFENGIRGMNLIDLLEMFCDWYAATKRHNDGDIIKSIESNKERFNMSDDLVEIFKNTVRDMNLQ